LKRQANEIESLSAPYHKFEIQNQDLMLETEFNPMGASFNTYQIVKDENIANDKELCNAYNQLQKDCEDLNVLMKILSKEIYVIIIIFELTLKIKF
jgi:hypothetical protein